MELTPTHRERWIRLAWPWGLISGLLLGNFLISAGPGSLALALGASGWGLFEFLTPNKVIMDAWAIEVTRLGRTHRIPWRNILCALPGVVLRGERARIHLTRTGMAQMNRLYLTLNYGYGHSADDLTLLINDMRARAIPDQPHPLPLEKLRKMERLILIGLPFLIVGGGLLLLFLGWRP